MQVPNADFLVFTTSCDVLSVGGDGKGVYVGFVGLEGVSDLEVGVPDLKLSVPSDRGEVGGEGLHFVSRFYNRRVSHAGNPVVVVVFVGRELAFGSDVP